MVVQVKTQDEFKQYLSDNNGKLVVVDFFATWCGPCKMIAPKLEELSKEYDNVKFFKVDVDELESLAAEYNVSAMPTFLFFKNGKKVDDVVGANIEKIREAINKYK